MKVLLVPGTVLKVMKEVGVLSWGPVTGEWYFLPEGTILLFERPCVHSASWFVELSERGHRWTYAYQDVEDGKMALL